jgi:RNA polymerase sigma-70 factor (sigma-E family)
MPFQLRPEEEASYSEYCASRIRALRRTAFALTRNWHDAENLVQDTLIKVYVRWRSIRGKDDVDSYVKRMLVNTILDDRRRSRHVREVISDVTPEPPAEAAYPLEGQLEMWQALANLGRSQRRVLVLRYWADLTVEETARVLGCSIGNVKSQTARGLAALERALSAGREGGRRS